MHSLAIPPPSPQLPNIATSGPSEDQDQMAKQQIFSSAGPLLHSALLPDSTCPTTGLHSLFESGGLMKLDELDGIDGSRYDN
jgi:hypothetical protein